MAAEVVGKLVAVAMDEERGGYLVQFWVGHELAERPTLNEAFALLRTMDALQRELFTVHVAYDGEQFTLEPDEALAQCLELYDEHDSAEELEPPLDRQWKTAQIADAIISQLIEANVFGAWRSADMVDEVEEVEEPAVSRVRHSTRARDE